MKKWTFGTIALICLLLPLLSFAAVMGATGAVTWKEDGHEAPWRHAADVILELEAVRGDLALAVYAGEASAAREASKRLEAVLTAVRTFQEQSDGDFWRTAELDSNLGALSAACGRASSLSAQGSLEEAAQLMHAEILPLFQQIKQGLERSVSAAEQAGAFEDAAGIQQWAARDVAALLAAGIVAAVCWRFLVRTVSPVWEAARTLDRFRSGEAFVPVSGGRCREGATLAEAVNQLAEAVTRDAGALSQSLDAMEKGKYLARPEWETVGPLAGLDNQLQKLFEGFGVSLERLTAFSERTAQEAEKLSAGAQEALDGATVRARLAQNLLDAAERLAQALRVCNAAMPWWKTETEQNGQQCTERLRHLLTDLAEEEETAALDQRFSAAIQRTGQLAVLAAGEQNGGTAARSEELRLLTLEWMAISQEIKRRAATREQALQNCMLEAQALIDWCSAQTLREEERQKRKAVVKERLLRLSGESDRFVSAAKAAAGAALAGVAQAELLSAGAAALAEGAAELKCAGTLLSGRFGVRKNAEQSVRLGPGVTYTIIPDAGEPPRAEKRPPKT